MPEGFDPSQFGGEMPEGFDSSQFGGEMPEGFDMSQFGGGRPERFETSVSKDGMQNGESKILSDTVAENLILYGVCLLVLVGGLVFASVFKRRKKKR